MKQSQLPLFADGFHLSQQELLACQNTAKAIPEKRGQARASLSGHRSSNIKGRGMEFAEVRHYQHGDDVRTIDWRVTARTGKTHTKLFMEERERPIIILLDLSHTLYFGSTLLLQSVQAAHVAATLGWSAIQHGDRLGGIITCEYNHIELKPRSRNQGILQFISAIQGMHQTQLTRFKNTITNSDHIHRACSHLNRLAKPGSLIWIITDGSQFDESCLNPLTNLKRHCDLGAFLITDPLRQGLLTLPKQFTLPVRDGNVEKILNRSQYSQWLNQQLNQQQTFVAMMNKLKVQTQFIDAGLPLQQQLELLR